MKLYLNSCEPAEIREIAQWGILDGVTMNPTMVAAINRDYVRNLKEICAIADIDVFAQVVAERAEQMVEEAKALAALHPRVIVKVQTSADGVQAIGHLNKWLASGPAPRRSTPRWKRLPWAEQGRTTPRSLSACWAKWMRIPPRS